MARKPASKVTGAPTFCHECNLQLQRAPGRGLGLLYAVVLKHWVADHVVRMHEGCAARVLRDTRDYVRVD